MNNLPAPETMLAYASILEKPQYVVKHGVRYKLPTGEIIEAACAALRLCAALKQEGTKDAKDTSHENKPLPGSGLP